MPAMNFPAPGPAIIFNLMVLLVGSSGLAQESAAQDKTDPQGSTIKGRILQHEKSEFQIDLNSLGCMLNQQVQLPDPPVPREQWPKMTQEQRENWVKEFEASDEGKAFIADRKKRIETAERFEIQVEENGSFVVYDVPAGLYGMRGRLEQEIDDKNYVFEVFGQIEVNEKVEELLLDPMKVVVTRLTKPNEAIPAMHVETFDGKATINNELLSGRNVLVSFWSLQSPPSMEFAKIVQQTYEDVKQQKQLQLLSICVDSDREQALKYVVDNELAGWHGYAASWDHETVSEFGVRSIPALFLLGADGRIKMTPFDFRLAINTPEAKLASIIVDVLDGKSIPAPVRTDNGTPAKVEKQ